MNYYEIVLLVDLKHNQKAQTYIDTYTNLIKLNKGTVTRLEDWGSKELAYTIKKKTKANYLLFNVECTYETINIIQKDLKYNSNILRYLITKTKQKINKPSQFLAELQEKKLHARL